MPNYSVHCSNDCCNYIGEFLYSTPNIPRTRCPTCNDGFLVRDEVQGFSVGNSSRAKSGKGGVEVSLGQITHCDSGKIVGLFIEVGVSSPRVNSAEN